MKVLTISPYPVLPVVHGGRVRTLGLATGLARAGAEVTILCPWYPGQPRRGLLPGGVRCRSHLLAANALPALLPSRLAPALALLSLQPSGSPGVRRHLRACREVDVVQLEFCANAGWAERLRPHARLVYSAHNVERDFLADGPGRQALRRWGLRRVERLERSAVQASDLLVACTRDDAERLAALYGGPRPAEVVPNGCDRADPPAERERLRGAQRRALGFADDERVIAFVGGDAFHNREAVRFLAGEVLPALGPRERLLVVGRSGCALGRDGDSRVRAVGFAPDLRPLLAAADVAVNPVAHGSGASVKVADYLGAGLPVVSTRAGVRGVDVAGAAVRVAPREAFAAALREPLPAASDGSRPPTWAELGRRLHARYERLLAGERPVVGV